MNAFELWNLVEKKTAEIPFNTDISAVIYPSLSPKIPLPFFAVNRSHTQIDVAHPTLQGSERVGFCRIKINK